MTTIRLTVLMRTLGMLLVMLGSLALQGCGGGSSGNSTPPGINAGMDYYDNVSNNGGGDIFTDTNNTTQVHISDLQAIVKGDQLMLVSVSENVAWFAKLTKFSSGSYTADVRVYKDNMPLGTATLTGTLTAGTAITGTLTGTGTAYGNGTFSLDISAENTTQADVANLVMNNPNFWGNFNLPSGSIFFIDSSGVVTNNSGGAAVGNFFNCEITGSVSAVANSALYKFQITLINCDPTVVAANGNYSGYAMTRSASATNDTLVVALENSTNGYSMYGEFTKN